jgi:hypothetical protein
MAARTDKQDWVWVPGVSLGPIRFGEPLPDAAALGDLTLRQSDSNPDRNWADYEANDGQVVVHVHYGRIAFVRCYRNLSYRSENMIGRPAAEVIRLVGSIWEEPMEFPNGAIRHVCPKLGVVMWEEDGVVESFALRKPRVWDWVPDIRFGDICFGEALPEKAGLLYRRDERNSDEESDSVDIVGEDVVVHVDPRSGRVVDIMTTDTAKFEGNELIGRLAESAKALIGGDWYDGGTTDAQTWENDDKGIILWRDSDNPEYVSGVLVFGEFSPDENGQ